VGTAILGRCFGGKFLNRCGFWEYCFRRIWPNFMTSQRDLIGRHAHAQYFFNIVFVMLLSIGAFSILAFEAFTGRQVSTPYTKTSCWIALLSNAFMSVLTEFCVTALTFVQRRQAIASNAGSQSFLHTFMAMHLPGMQPYSITFRGMFGFGPAAERSFETLIQEPAITDRCHCVMGLTPEEITSIAIILFAFSTGPQIQALKLIHQSDTDICGSV